MRMFSMIKAAQGFSFPAKRGRKAYIYVSRSPALTGWEENAAHRNPAKAGLNGN